MKDYQKLAILQTAKGSGKVNNLLKEGFLFSDIAVFIEELQAEGLLSVELNGEIKITSEGVSVLKNLRKNNTKEKNKWIQSENRSKIPKIDKNFVFLPNQSEIEHYLTE